MEFEQPKGVFHGRVPVFGTKYMVVFAAHSSIASLCPPLPRSPPRALHRTDNNSARADMGAFKLSASVSAVSVLLLPPTHCRRQSNSEQAEELEKVWVQYSLGDHLDHRNKVALQLRPAADTAVDETTLPLQIAVLCAAWAVGAARAVQKCLCWWCSTATHRPSQNSIPNRRTWWAALLKVQTPSPPTRL